MSDSTTFFIQRKIRHVHLWIAGVATLACPIVALFLPAELGNKITTAANLIGGSCLLATAGQRKKEAKSRTAKAASMMPGLWAVAAACLLAGCSTFKSAQREETMPDGTVVRETTIKARTFFDAKSDLSKLRASTTDKTQGMTIGALGQEATGSNAASLVEGIVGAAVRAAVNK
jgi:hypothetical protein